ncbi:MAG: trigger factor, partial [Anaerococcus obesiensis]
VGDFEKQVEGHKVGDKFDVNVTFPEDYQAKEFQGKDARFEVEINSISRKELPEIDDEFAKDISEFETLEELKEDTKKNLKEEKEKSVKNQIQNEAIKALVEKSEVNAPDPLVNQEIDLEMQNLDQRLRQMGISLQQYIEMTKMDMSAIRDQYRAVAEDKVKANLVMDEVALKENIEVSDEEIENEIKDAAKQYGVDDYEKFKEIFEKNVSRDTVIENVKRRKAVELLEKNVKLVPAKKEEENKEDEKED